MSQLGRWSFITAALALAACSHKQDAGTRDSAAGAVSSTPGASAPDPTHPASAAPASGTMSDANILAKEKGGDSAEVAIATFALSHASDPQVKGYAKLLVDDHGKGLREVQSLAGKLSITPQPPANDTTSQATAHALAHLATLKGHDFDTAFVKHEIADHKADIEDAHKAAAAAQNAEVKQLVEKSLPELQKHLARAEELERKLAGGKD
jgi:putative membrane protein